MNLELAYEKTRALLNLLVEAIEDDRYPFSPTRSLYAKPLGGDPPKFGLARRSCSVAEHTRSNRRGDRRADGGSSRS